MEFCQVCDNMYYIKFDDSNNNNKIIFYCNNCNFEIQKDLDNNNCIYTNNYSIESKDNYQDYVNQYTHLDPTLPRVSNIDCPNLECICNKNKEQKKEVIYIKYDDTNLKFLYLCCHCKTIWKNEMEGVKLITI